MLAMSFWRKSTLTHLGELTDDLGQACRTAPAGNEPNEEIEALGLGLTEFSMEMSCALLLSLCPTRN